MSAYECTLGVSAGCLRTIRHSWEELTLSISLDFDFGRAIKDAPNSPSEFERLRLDEFPDSTSIFVDGSRDAGGMRTGVGSPVLFLNYRFGVRFSGFTSVLSLEL